MVHGSPSGRRRIGALLMAIAVAFASAAACYAATLEMTGTARMSCCAGAGHACESALTTQQDCCAAPSSELASSSPHVVPPPSPALPRQGDDALVANESRPGADLITLAASGPPAHHLASSLRI